MKLRNKKLNNSTTHIFPITLTTIIASIAILFFAISQNWFVFNAQTASAFCEEELKNGFVKEWSNTWSNLAFCIVALMVSYRISYITSNKNNPFTKRSFFAILFCLAAALLGPGSMALHATTSQIGGRLDVFSMFIMSSFLFAYAIYRLFSLSESKFKWTYIICLIIASATLFIKTPGKIFHLGLVDITFGIFAIGGTVMELIYMKKANTKRLYAYLYMAFFALAFFLWQFEFKDCDPTRPLQYHAMWHILNAISVYFIFRYYWSENDFIFDNSN